MQLLLTAGQHYVCEHASELTHTHDIAPFISRKHSPPHIHALIRSSAVLGADYSLASAPGQKRFHSQIAYDKTRCKQIIHMPQRQKSYGSYLASECAGEFRCLIKHPYIFKLVAIQPVHSLENRPGITAVARTFVGR